MIARSYLFVPAERPERFVKALASAAHRVVIDLEDAVLPERKNQAREALFAFLTGPLGEADAARLVVRVNAHGTPWHEEDVQMIREAGKFRGNARRVRGTGPDAGTAVSQIMVPKAEHGKLMDEIAGRCQPGTLLIALIETVAGMVHMREIAQSRAVARLAFGSVDYALDAGVEGGAREFDHVRSCFVIESRYAGKESPIDGVTLAVDDADEIAEDAVMARRFGFGAKLCIHPKQVDVVNRQFLPSAAETAWATRVITAISNRASDRSGGSAGGNSAGNSAGNASGNPSGAITVDGKLVDKPIVDRARRILAS